MVKRLSTCLNLEARAYNFSLVGLAGSAIGLALGMISMGVLAGVFLASVGLAIGTVVGGKLHNGFIQRYCYWMLPISNFLICKKTPKSHVRSYH
jgi:hypothetical protein